MEGMIAADPSVWKGRALSRTSKVRFEAERVEDMFKARS